MKFKTIKKWVFRIVLVLLVLSAAAFIWTDYHIDDMWGAHTEIVDHQQFKTPKSLIVIENVNALSPDGKSMRTNQTVVIEHGEIRAVGSSLSIPDEALVIDGNGKYLIPGLIDSHVHMWKSPNDLLLYLANGVTTVREMNGSEDHIRWREEVEDGRIGPNIFVASNRISSNSLLAGLFHQWTAKTTSISSPDKAKALLTSLKTTGYDAVKISSFLSKEDFYAANKAVDNVAIPIVGHIPIDMALDDIWGSNLKELAHIEEIVKALNREFGGFTKNNAAEFLQFVEARSNEVSRRLAENSTAVVTTLWLMESFVSQKHDLDSVLNKVELAYVNPGITELSPLSSRVMGWLEDSNIYRIGQDHTHEELEGNKSYWTAYARANQILLRSMVNKGVVVMAGTDTNVPAVVPGFSLHDELKSLTNAGMTPAQALLSTTAVPASRMNIKSGKIAEGFAADLLLLNANPLLEIEHTKSIDAVITNGRLLLRQRLDRMLSAVKAANDKSRTASIDRYR